MKTLLLLFVLVLTLTSCVNNLNVKVISTGERTIVHDYDDIYKKGDTIYIYNSSTTLNGWVLDSNWLDTKKDTVINSVTYRRAVIQ